MKPMGLLYDETVKRMADLRAAGYVVEEIWECEWNRMLRNNAELADAVDKLDIMNPLNPRDALAGGR